MTNKQFSRDDLDHYVENIKRTDGLAKLNWGRIVDAYADLGDFQGKPFFPDRRDRFFSAADPLVALAAIVPNEKRRLEMIDAAMRLGSQATSEDAAALIVTLLKEFKRYKHQPKLLTEEQLKQAMEALHSAHPDVWGQLRDLRKFAGRPDHLDMVKGVVALETLVFWKLPFFDKRHEVDFMSQLIQRAQEIASSDKDLELF